MFERVLCLSVHRDDEALGCGGTLFKCANLHIMYFNNAHPAVPKAVYNAEAAAVKRELDCTTSYSKFMRVNQLDQFPITDFIADIEETINWFKPTTLLVPANSYNQDHRVVLDAATTAIRMHDTNFFVKNVLLYEQPETCTPTRFDYQFIPHVFVPIDIEKKIKLFQLYRSQQRGHRTAEHLRYLAGVRGMQANVPFAEAFSVIRLVQ